VILFGGEFAKVFRVYLLRSNKPNSKKTSARCELI